MSSTIKPTKTFQETLKYLGKDFSSKVIDGELCGYYKINDYYDIEISGMNNNRVKISILQSMSGTLKTACTLKNKKPFIHYQNLRDPLIL